MFLHGKNHCRIITEDLVLIEDGTGIEKVYDCIDEIILELKKLIPLDKRRIIYRDRDGTLEQVVIKYGEFSHFIALDSKDPALLKIQSLMVLI